MRWDADAQKERCELLRPMRCFHLCVVATAQMVLALAALTPRSPSRSHNPHPSGTPPQKSHWETLPTPCRIPTRMCISIGNSLLRCPDLEMGCLVFSIQRGSQESLFEWRPSAHALPGSAVDNNYVVCLPSTYATNPWQCCEGFLDIQPKSLCKSEPSDISATADVSAK